MNIPTRDHLERRLHALVADNLDRLAEDQPDGFDLGVVAFAMEVLTPQEPPDLLREEGGYTPASDVSSHWVYYCSDHRWWVKEAVFSQAHDFYAYPSSNDNDEEGEEQPDE